ncbi:MAG: hypothetical protein LBT41_04950 [Candidatus Methanoplasma sp.]|nr:hypothetical protein [Candidatus Methanoplasma sp.]
MILLKDNSIDAFAEIVKTEDDVLFEYLHLNANAHLIGKETIEMMIGRGDAVTDDVDARISKYNDKLLKMDSSEPYALVSVCLNNGFKIGICI